LIINHFRATYILILHKDEENDDNNDSTSTNNQRYALTQRKTIIKDYCHGKLDPTPGGVVECNESYRDNTKRELLEEMSVSIEEIKENNKKDKNKNTYELLFAIKYVDNIVKCWGDLWEVTYHGSVSD